MAYRYPTVKVDGRTKLKHRHVAEKVLGRALQPGEEVHHLNEDPFDPSPINLEVLAAPAHRQIHADKRLVYAREKACSVCGGSFIPHRTKRKRQITCSGVCANEQRSRSERATKARRAKPERPYPLLQAAE